MIPAKTKSGEYLTTELHTTDGFVFTVPAHRAHVFAAYSWFRTKDQVSTLIRIEGNDRVWIFSLDSLLGLDGLQKVNLKAHFHPAGLSYANKLQAIRNAENSMICSEKPMALWELYANKSNKLRQ